MRHLTFSLLILASFVIGSCSEKEAPIPQAYKEAQFELNRGEKWEVSKNMISYMNESFILLENANKNKDVNFSELADELTSLKNEFVSNCDMKGHGHDVLHAWLMPYIGLLDNLTESNNKAEQQRILKDLNWSKEKFKEYFQ